MNEWDGPAQMKTFGGKKTNKQKNKKKNEDAYTSFREGHVRVTGQLAKYCLHLDSVNGVRCERIHAHLPCVHRTCDTTSLSKKVYCVWYAVLITVKKIFLIIGIL